jgi:hypothetical protein
MFCFRVLAAAWATGAVAAMTRRVTRIAPTTGAGLPVDIFFLQTRQEGKSKYYKQQKCGLFSWAAKAGGSCSKNKTYGICGMAQLKKACTCKEASTQIVSSRTYYVKHSERSPAPLISEPSPIGAEPSPKYTILPCESVLLLIGKLEVDKCMQYQLPPD